MIGIDLGRAMPDHSLSLRGGVVRAFQGSVMEESQKDLVRCAKGRGVDVQGPLPSDTVFVAARKGAFDAVVSMYHDQGQIAMKLIGFEGGVTVLGGLPVPVTTCASGTAFDIVGKGVANVDGLKNALAINKRMAASLLETAAPRAGRTGAGGVPSGQAAGDHVPS